MLSVIFELGVGAQTSVIAVARLLRLLKIMAKVPQLRIILSGLTAGVRSVSAIMLLLLLIIFLSSIICCVLFGPNSPFRFGTVQQSMLTLFQISTLSGWHDIFQVAYFGCDQFDMGQYRNAHKRSKLYTDFGWFYGFECYNPKRNPVAAVIFFSVFTLFTAMVVLSLFISVITMSMFEVIELKKMEQSKRRKIVGQRLRMKRAHLIEELEDPGTALAWGVEHVFNYEVSKMKEAQEQSKNARCYLFAHVCHEIEQSKTFQTIVVMAILAIGVFEAMLTNEKTWTWIEPANIFCLVLFTFEIIVKILAKDMKPLTFFENNWNCFDFVVVVLAIIDMLGIPLGPVSVIRMLRILRVVRLLHSSPGLRSVVHALLLACAKVSAALMMTGIANYIFTVVGMLLFSKNE